MHLKEYGIKETKKLFANYVGYRIDFIVEKIIKKTKSLKLRDIIVFECETDFQDSPREFYNYLIREQLNRHIKMVWLVKNPTKFKKDNKEKHVVFVNRNDNSRKNRLRLSFYLNTAKWFIFSHPYWFQNWREGQTVINTTHSIAQLKDANGQLAKKRICDFVLCSSDYCRDIKMKSFGMNDDNYLIIGLPRIDVLAKNNKPFKLINKDPNQKIVISMETFKQSKNWNDSKSNDKYAINVINTPEELIEFDTYLKANNMKLIVKIHHLQDMQYINFVKLNNIIYLTDEDLIERDIQVNELLAYSDVLLTDYSSVFYDYLVLDRPIGFMIGDIKEYDRGFISEKPLEEMPGAIINNFDELKEFLTTVNEYDNYKADRKRIREKVYKYTDFNNSKRLFEWMCRRDKQC